MARHVASRSRTRTKQVLVMNIKREFFAKILAVPRRKDIEYRLMSQFWRQRLAKVGAAPFNLRLLNGMLPPVPEATVRVTKVVRNHRGGQFQLHLGRVLSVKNWDRSRECPRRRVRGLS